MPHGELLYGSFTNLFIIGWLAITIAAMLSPTRVSRKRLLLVGGRIIPGILLLTFTAGWLANWDLPGSITSYEGLLTLFSVPEKVLAAWFEALGLALLVAHWMVENASAQKVPIAITLPSLVATFVAAAMGLIMFVFLTWLWRMKSSER